MNNMEWIKVSDRLPEEYMRVAVFKIDVALICTGTAIYIDGKFRIDGTFISNNKLFEKVAGEVIKPTHWMPLPEPPNQ